MKMVENESQALRDYIADTWSEIDVRLRIESSDSNKEMISWLNVLGVFQSKAEMFGLSRVECGLPIEDADVLFLKYTAKA